VIISIFSSPSLPPPAHPQSTITGSSKKGLFSYCANLNLAKRTSCFPEPFDTFVTTQSVVSINLNLYDPLRFGFPF
ncbi:uncharacterized protein METZ01_LOCUS234354, partial [marine metagenome]